MAKKVYIGVGGVARKVKKLYFGVGGVARKVKKGYIGIGGVARPFFAEGIAQYGTLSTVLDKAIYDLSATQNGTYALFGGGYSKTTTVTAFNTSLVKTSCDPLQTGRNEMAAARAGKYAVFAGGHSSSSPYATGRVDYYDTSLTHGYTALSSSHQRTEMGGTTLGDVALFAGGYDSDDKRNTTLYAFSGSTATLSNTGSGLSSKRANVGATTVGNYAIFAGGGSYSVVDAFDSSYVRTVATSLTTTGSVKGATTGNYALFGMMSDYSTVDVYSSTLVKGTPLSLATSRISGIAITFNDYAVFIGGTDDGSTYNAAVESFASDLTRQTLPDTSVIRTRFAGTTIGNYMLIGGGRLNTYTGTSTDSVEAYVI